MYEGVKTRVWTTAGNTEYFPMNLSLHQGSSISPYVFTLILDELSRGIQENIPWCMIFADDIVLIAESTERVEVAELRMLRWTCGKTMVDMISNEVFRAALDVDSIIDKIREGRLR
uniref:Ubiquitin-protein ligase E3 C n=1 Tax=Tanacetum cinerariifolium TaxID=118510 RepID=A0A6L2KHG5_TANCI|nr:ubiquitin-protein ligase E3 C [Tanacetum cinerariifolium]